MFFFAVIRGMRESHDNLKCLSDLYVDESDRVWPEFYLHLRASHIARRIIFRAKELRWQPALPQPIKPRDIPEGILYDMCDRGMLQRFLADSINEAKSGRITAEVETECDRESYRLLRGRCPFCNVEMIFDKESNIPEAERHKGRTYDHLWPKELLGPGDVAENVIACCKSCNNEEKKSGFHWSTLDQVHSYCGTHSSHIPKSVKIGVIFYYAFNYSCESRVTVKEGLFKGAKSIDGSVFGSFDYGVRSFFSIASTIHRLR